MKSHKVMLFGDINLDVSMPVPEIPSPGQDVYVEQLSFNIGGSATNTAIDLSLLGILPLLMGSIGTDANGDRLLKNLQAYNLDTRTIFRKDASPSGQIFLAILPDGERSMFSFRGANILTCPEDIPVGWEATVDLLHLSGYVFLKSPQRDTALDLIKTASENHIPVSIDTGMDPVLLAHSDMKKVLSSLSICICGLREGAVFSGKEEPSEILASLMDMGIDCVAIKLGNQGCLVGLKRKVYRLPALKIHAIDTTGSGDAFSAGILTAWLNNFELPAMCMLANSLGAFMASHLGSINPQLSWASLVDFLKQIRDLQSVALQKSIEELIQLVSEQ